MARVTSRAAPITTAVFEFRKVAGPTGTPQTYTWCDLDPDGLTIYRGPHRPEAEAAGPVAHDPGFELDVDLVASLMSMLEVVADPVNPHKPGIVKTINYYGTRTEGDDVLSELLRSDYLIRKTATSAPVRESYSNFQPREPAYALARYIDDACSAYIGATRPEDIPE
jgi:hypothetical protein